MSRSFLRLSGREGHRMAGVEIGMLWDWQVFEG